MQIKLLQNNYCVFFIFNKQRFEKHTRTVNNTQ